MKFDVQNGVRYQAGRRRFFSQVARVLIAIGALPVARASGADPEDPVDCGGNIKLPGRLGDPDLTLLKDERLDPRVRKVLGAPPATGKGIFPPNVTMTSSYEECLDFVGGMEKFLRSQDSDFLASMPKFTNVVSTKESISGVDGNKINLYIDRPKTRGKNLPCVVHIHGGGMSFTTAQRPHAVRWRKTLAEHEMIVIGVEFRNAGGDLGNHPFPAGLNDCAQAVLWAHENRSGMSISSIVIAGESGGANLAIATAVKANLEGWAGVIDGVFAMAPMILGFYSSVPSELLSWRENEGYQGTPEMMRAMAKVYDPDDKHENNPLAWPFHATGNQLKGLPPHIITNYELDLIRDDGVMFTRKLQAAGVSAMSRTISGVPHVPEIAMPDIIPELTRDTIGSILGLAGISGK